MIAQLAPGQRLGDFELVREVGRGGMGVVYEARQVSLNRAVALKVLAAGVGASPRAVQRFRREAEAAGRLHHSHIVPVHAVGEQDGTHFYAMEFVRGESLDRVLDRRRQADGRETPPPEQVPTEPYVPGGSSAPPLGSPSILPGSGPAYFDAVAALVADAADALDHAHRQGVVHRDVKPSNLLLAADGRIQVTDFGLARILEEPGVTVPGEFVGTPAYMSPEQVAAGRVAIDHRTDVYSLGATLYELLTLRPPFSGPGRDQLLAQVLQKEPAPPRSLNPAIPRDLETICLKCLEKDPDRRYQTGKELADDLRRFSSRFAIQARRPGLVTKFTKWVKRNPALSAVALLALVAVGVAGYVGWQAYRSHQEHVAERQRAVIDKGMVAAMAADLPAARAAVAEAEALGTSAGELHLLRGFIAHFSDDSHTAIRECRAAVEAMPRSVAARALLSRVLGETADNSLTEQELKEAERLPIQAPEDRLFLGWATCGWDSAAGLQHIRRAVEERPSHTGSVLLAEALFQHAATTGTTTDAEEALRAARRACDLLPGNSSAAINRVWASLTAAAAYDLAGDLQTGAAHLQAAVDLADALPVNPIIPGAWWARYWVATYRDGTTPPLRAIDSIPFPATLNDPSILGFKAAVLWRLGRIDEAQAVLGTAKLHEQGNWMRIGLALERPDGRPAAHAAWLAAAEPEYNAYQLTGLIPWLYLTGRPDLVPVMAAKHRASGYRDRTMSAADWDTFLRFWEGKLTEDQFLAAPAANRKLVSWRRTIVGMKYLGEGKRDEARAAFERVVADRSLYQTEWESVYTFLIRMNTDPEWPRAIPLKPKP